MTVPPLARVGDSDLPELLDFLTTADLTLSGLDSPSVRLWIARDESGAIVASTGFELSDSGSDALIRSVAVSSGTRGMGWGLELAAYALEQAVAAGATRAWLFSRRSGPFWQKLAFEPADRDELARALASTHQVRLFTETGQLAREVAWFRWL